MTEVPVTPEVPQEAAAPEISPESPQGPPAEQPKPGKTVEQLQTELARTKNEAAGYRVKLKELEPIAKQVLEAEEAKKDGEQKAIERAEAAEQREKATLEGYTRLELAVQYGIQPDDIDLIGTGSREEMDVRAQRLAALTAAAAKATPPPTNQPVEGLRPGASPEPANPPDDSYPESWKPTWLRGNDKESRIQHGQ